MRRFLLALVALTLFAAAPVHAQEADEPTSVSLQVWTATSFDTDEMPDFLSRVSFGPVIHLSPSHSFGLHANFLDAFFGDDEHDGAPTATLAYAYTNGPVSVGGGVTFEDDGEGDGEDDGWNVQPGFSLGWENVALWLSGDRGSLGVVFPLF